MPATDFESALELQRAGTARLAPHIEPALLPFVAERPDVTTTRVAKSGNKQVGAQLSADQSWPRTHKETQFSPRA